MADGWGYVSFVESSAMKLEWEKLIFQIASDRPGEVPASQLPCDFEDSKGVLNNRSSFQQRNIHRIPGLQIASPIWVFPKIAIPQNGWFLMENPIKMVHLGVPIIFGNTHITW